MKYLKQAGIILIFSFISEFLHALLPLPIPASIYGIILLFICLNAKIIQVSSIKETSCFLIEIMPFMFIPAGVGLIDSWDILKPSFLAYITITALSTVAVMIVTGKITQAIIHIRKEKSVSHE